MNLKDYQELALRTAVPTARTHTYLVPMIIGEIGELFGQQAKAHRDGWTPEYLQQQMVKEYGDVAWGVAVLLADYEIDALDAYGWTLQSDPRAGLLHRSISLYQAWTDEGGEEYLSEAAEALWYTLGSHCRALTGQSFDDVLEANVAKLAARQAAGTLQGSGDHR